MEDFTLLLALKFNYRTVWSWWVEFPQPLLCTSAAALKILAT